ncbi:MAG TPA: alpha-amylase family glycosyl hydrolase [Blastocatellia bacterium]|jgi:glycosidase
MRNIKNLSRPWLVIAAILVARPECVARDASVALPAQAAPEVMKVEPPNWWPRHSINPVRVMIRGRNLAGAQVVATGAGLRVTGQPKVNANGTYLFVDVSIVAGAQPGARKLAITTRGGRADAPFEILAPLPRAGRFQGITNDDIIYLIMPDRFSNGDRSNDDPAKSKGLFNRSNPKYYHGGDLRGIIERLPYLKELGVTALWLNPWYDNTDRPDERETYEGHPTTGYHGYGAIDFYSVDEHLGDIATLRELVERAHAAGIKIIQDQVANHTGPYHPWVKDTPTPTWFNGSEAKHINETWQTWALKDPYSSPELLRSVLDGWFIDILPDLNQNDAEARRYIIQNSLWWVGITGLDAIRQDTLPYVPRTFWKEWMTAIKREYPGVNVIGETYDGDPAQVAFFQGGKRQWDGIDSGIDTEFDFPLFFAIREAFAKGESVRKLAEILSHDYLYADADILVPFLGLHDMLRFMSEEKASREGLMLAQTFLMTTRGIPLIYYGDEIAMEGRGDPDNRRDFPGGFPGDNRNAFSNEGRTREMRQVLDHLRRVVGLRRELDALRHGKLVTLAVADQQYAFARHTQREFAIAVFNNDSKEAMLEIDTTPLKLATQTTLIDRLAVAKDIRLDGTTMRVTIPARSAAILTRR